MTEKLYYSQPNLKEWVGKVKSVKKKNGRAIVELEQTAFYPEGGGQPSDRGWIDDLEVLDVYEEQGRIYHLLSGEIYEDKVRCRLDFAQRFDHMQQHSGQHLLSAVFMDLYGGETKGFHLGQEHCCIDIALQGMTHEIIEKVEMTSNDYIYQDLKVKTYLIDQEELNTLPLRKFPKVTEDIRIVEIDRFDYSPCCGTHVPSTGQLGIIKINKFENYKGMTRVYFKCGWRAFEDYRSKEAIITNLVSQMSTPEKDLILRVSQEQMRLKSLVEEVADLKEQLLRIEGEQFLKSAEGSHFVLRLDKSFEEVQKLSRVMLELGAAILILSSLKDNKIVFCHNGSLNYNCGQLVKEGLNTLTGRGGGGTKQAQIAFNNRGEMEKFEKYLAGKVISDS